MAKKRVEQENDEYEEVEPEVNDPLADYVGLDQSSLVLHSINFDQVEPTISKPGGAAVSLDTDERTYRVSFALPYGVLVALIDPMHSDADTEAAFELFLVKLDNTPTTLGYLVLSGIDQTAIRHKMNAAWREQHNRGVDSDKTGFKKAE